MVKKFFTLNCFFVVMILISIFFTACSLKYLPHGELIDITVSPNNEYVVNAYLCSGNATTDFSVRCEVVDLKTNKSRNIYWNYHQEDVSWYWKSQDVIVINNIELNVLTDEYDWRNY